MRIQYLLLLLIVFLPVVLADVDAEFTFQGLYADGSCQSILSGNITAGSTASVQVLIKNIGSEAVQDSELFVQTYFGSGDSKNYGMYNHGSSILDLSVGEERVVCYSFTQRALSKPTNWFGKLYFRSQNQQNFLNTLSGEYEAYEFSYNVTNISDAWQEIKLVQSPPGNLEADVGEEVTYSVTITNLNPLRDFNGSFWIGINSPLTFTDSTKSKRVDLAPLENTVYYLNASPLTFPGEEVVLNHFVDADDGQQNFRKWPRLNAEGTKYQYKVVQLYPNQTVYAPNDKGFFTAEIKNTGDKGATWTANGDFEYNFLVRGADALGVWSVLMNESVVLQSAVSSGKTTIVTSPVFTNTFSSTLTDFTIQVSVLNTGAEIQKTWNANYASYTATSYPDITSSCTRQQTIDTDGIREVFECDANGNEVVFVQGVIGYLESVSALSGRKDLYWEGEQNGIPGVFIKGDVNSIYQVVWLTTQTVELSAINMSLVVIISSFLVLLFFWRRAHS